MKFRKILIKLDDLREEKIEDFIADKILANLDKCSKVDELEKQAIMAGGNVGTACFTK